MEYLIHSYLCYLFVSTVAAVHTFVISYILRSIFSYELKYMNHYRSQVVTCEDSSRTPYTHHEPKIMILRRPQEKSDPSVNGLINIKQKQPVKTLEQVRCFYTCLCFYIRYIISCTAVLQFSLFFLN